MQGCRDEQWLNGLEGVFAVDPRCSGFQLARLVPDHADALLPLWCSRSQYPMLYQGTLPPDREPQAIELVFTEIYVDSLIEVHRRSGVAAFLTGRFPGSVPLTNPRALHIWNGNLRLMFSANEQRVVDRVIAQEG